MIRFVVKDWNGTLLADTQAVVNAGNNVIVKYGGRLVLRAQYTEEFSFPALNYYLAQGCDRGRLTQDVFVREFYVLYNKFAAACRTRRGTRQLLSWERERSIGSVILSNHECSDIALHLERLGLKDYFDHILGNSTLADSIAGNTKTGRMASYLDEYGIDPTEAVIVGDSPEEVEIGKRFGMKTIAITGGNFSTSRLRATGPDYLINSLHAVVRIIDKCNR